MITPIPGAESLGFGFNVFGTYDVKSRIAPLFEIDYDPSKQWQNYNLPENASFDPSSRSYGDSYAFVSKEEVQEHFASKVKLSGKYKVFSGEFGTDFSQDVRSDSDFNFGLVESFNQSWSLDMKDASGNNLAHWVRNDPDFINLPSTYSDKNRYLFFRFFDKYGIAFITGVSVGSRLFYSCSTLKTHSYSRQDISAHMRMEYDAVFVKAGAEASAEWNRVGENWAQNRSVHVSAVGGDNSILSVLAPGFNDNANSAYKEWLASAQKIPAVIDFRLASISKLFSGDQAQAVQMAVDAYVASRLYVESKTGGCMINFDGAPVVPPGGGDRQLGFQMAAIDRRNLQVAFTKSYNVQKFWDEAESQYQTALADFAPYNTSDFAIVFTTWSYFGHQYPTADFCRFLENCGAGLGLRNWKNLYELHLLPNSCDIAHCNYLLVGIPGSDKDLAHELFGRAGSADTGSPHWGPWKGWYDLPAPNCSLELDFYSFEKGDLHGLSLAGPLKTKLPETMEPTQACRKVAARN